MEMGKTGGDGSDRSRWVRRVEMGQTGGDGTDRRRVAVTPVLDWLLSSLRREAHRVSPAGGALAEGFHERLREFQSFERTFEVRSSWGNQPPMITTIVTLYFRVL